MCLPFVGARATCPYNKINNKEILFNSHISDNFWGNSSQRLIDKSVCLKSVI